MDFILDIIEQNQVYIIIGLVVLSIVFLIIAIVNSAKCSSLKKKYDAFMQGKDGKSLEDDILFRLEQIDELIESNAANERNIDLIFKLAMLNERNDGYVLNVVHSREGCFSYVKEIIAGNPILSLSPEEQEALEDALLKDEQ